MNESDDHGDTGQQSGQPSPFTAETIPTAENIGEWDEPSNSEANGGGKNGGFKKWVQHLWSRDPDRQLELILAGAITLFALCQLVVTVINNFSTSAQVDKIIAAAGSIKESAGEIKNSGWMFSGAAQGINNAGWNAVGRLQEQADEVKRSVDEVVSTDRAFVFVRSIANIPFPKPSGGGIGTYEEGQRTRFMVIANWQNSGATPTRDLKIRFGCGSDPFKVKSPAQTLSIGPKGEEELYACRISEYEIVSLNARTYGWYVWGRATYGDVFGGHHLTEFCKEGTWTEPDAPTVAYTTCPGNLSKFNCSDKECEDYKSYMKPNATP
jgi:hypothetical protein